MKKDSESSVHQVYINFDLHTTLRRLLWRCSSYQDERRILSVEICCNKEDG